ncbi:MAG: hypothetical protein LBE83_06420, partial [Propionibacteriaceae bacterium]|nr:hypothetical protein [Propionibacteriaceae bacterium]
MMSGIGEGFGTQAMAESVRVDRVDGRSWGARGPWWWLVLSVVTALAVLVSGVVSSPAFAVPPSSVPSTRSGSKGSPEDVAPLAASGASLSPSVGTSSVVGVTGPAPVVEARAVVSSDSFDVETSVLVAQDESTQTFKNLDGTFTTAVFAVPRWVQLSDGSWTEVGTVVTPTVDGGGRVDRNPLSPRFAASGDSEDLLSVTRNGVSLSISLLGAKASSLKSRGSRATYSGAAGDGSDLVYEVTSGSVKEAVVLSVPPKRAPEYRWLIKGSGFTARVGVDGRIEIVSLADGSVTMSIPPALVVDSSGVTGVSEPAMVNAPMMLTQQDGAWLLTITPSLEWLQDPARVYPVSVDPTIS